MPRVVPPIDGKSSTSPTNTVNPSLVESIAGFSAGVAATLAVHPLDILKTRLQLDQNHKSQWGDSFRVLRRVVRDEGGSLRSLYRGLTPNMIGNSVSWALYFVWYRQLKDLAQAYRGYSTHLTSSDFFLASATSGILTAICTNPIWVIKTRMISTGRNAPGAYRGTVEGALHIAKTEGIKGFYRGLLPSLFGVSHGAIQFMAYEKLKRWRSVQKYHASDGMPEDGKWGGELTNLDWFCTSALSKMFAGSITYPYQVVRSRLQTYDAGMAYRGAGDVLKQVWMKEGIRGFYKGLAPNIIRVLPSTCVTFMVYENTKLYVPRLMQASEAAEAVDLE